jgi:hypothetical protein
MCAAALTTINAADFRARVISPVLTVVSGPDAYFSGADAEEALLTRADLTLPLFGADMAAGGPVYGPWKMTKARHDEIWAILSARDDLIGLRDRLISLRAGYPEPAVQMATNLPYAAAMARINLWLFPAEPPPAPPVISPTPIDRLINHLRGLLSQRSTWLGLIVKASAIAAWAWPDRMVEIGEAAAVATGFLYAVTNDDPVTSPAAADKKDAAHA